MPLDVITRSPFLIASSIFRRCFCFFRSGRISSTKNRTPMISSGKSWLLRMLAAAGAGADGCAPSWRKRWRRDMGWQWGGARYPIPPPRPNLPWLRRSLRRSLRGPPRGSARRKMGSMDTVPGIARGKRAVVAMSGGVDSSVAAWLLAREGYELVGLFMRNGVHVSESEARRKSCCSVGDARDARMVAAGLGIPFQAVDLKDEFGAIIRYFVAEYSAGRTPNPCAVCNRDLNVGRLFAFADELGADFLATGHYARSERHPS